MSFERISSDPDRMQGLPCIRGTRVTVSAVLGQLAAGRSIDDVIEDHPQLERADVLGAIEYAAAATRDREIPLTAAGGSCRSTRTSHPGWRGCFERPAMTRSTTSRPMDRLVRW
jgi:uncharacterized protein (DUF433 family)